MKELKLENKYRKNIFNASFANYIKRNLQRKIGSIKINLKSIVNKS